MKRRNKILIAVFVLATMFALQSCLKDNTSPVISAALESNALVLDYLETHGDYINSDQMPSIVSVDEVYNNIDNYLVIDVRSEAEYSSGHISRAVNVQNDALIGFLNTQNTAQYPKIIIVSTDGQAAAYYTCLLRLYGIDNVYSLNFGMAQWNSVFSNVWSSKIGDNSTLTKFFTTDQLSLPDPNNTLPEVAFDKQTSTQDNVTSRISDLVNEGFVDGQTYVNIGAAPELTFNNEDAANFFTICYGPASLYFVYGAIAHIPRAYSYLPGRDLKSTTHLQALPPNKKIVVYSISGQASAFVVAYLRTLGYDAKSLLYGANQLFYSSLNNYSTNFSPYIFLNSDIRNYPYATGSSPK